MRLFLSISAFGLASVVAASAGQIDIGGSATGLTSNYILQGAGAVCAAGPGKCVAGSTTGWAERNYDNILFSGVTSGGGLSSPAPFAGYTQSGGEPANSSITDSKGNTFATISDGADPLTDASYNYWASTSTSGGKDSITVPIGISGVSDVWTMMDNEWGSLGLNDTSVTFNFGSTSNQVGGYTSITVNLLDTNNTGSNGDMRAAVACTVLTTATCHSGTNPSGTLAQGNVVDGVTINTGVAYNTFAYTAANPTGFYAGTQGHLKLDTQEFVFNNPSLLGDYLVSLTVTENLSNTPASEIRNSASFPSETALSAIDVDTVTATPEPTTILLLLSGLGGFVFLRFRRA
jgi:hypothetical protein